MCFFSIILVPLLCSQILEQNVSQVIQRFSELDRVHQGVAADIGPIVPVQVLAAKKESDDLFAAVAEPDARKVAAHAQIKCASEDVRGLKACQ